MVAGITASILAWIMFKPTLNRRRIDRFLEWVFTRIPPETDPACTPRYWTSHAGVIVKGPWT